MRQATIGRVIRRRPRGRLRRRVYRPIALLAGVALIGAIVVAFGMVAFLASLPSVSNAQALVAAELQEHGGVAMGHPLRAKVATAVVAVEDRRFYQHHGLDSLGLLRAAWYIVTTGSPHGGATLTEQLAGLLYVPDDHTLGGELNKIGMAIKLERHYSKQQILAMYLNAVYLGDGNWGVEQASEAYFHRTADDLNWGEASLLAGLPNAPSAFDPTRHLERAKERQRIVLAALVREDVLTQAQAAAAFEEVRRVPE